MGITEGLRELADDLRKLAASWDNSDYNCNNNSDSRNRELNRELDRELDSEKVLDFLIFYGGGARDAR